MTMPAPLVRSFLDRVRLLLIRQQNRYNPGSPTSSPSSLLYGAARKNNEGRSATVLLGGAADVLGLSQKQLGSTTGRGNTPILVPPKPPEVGTPAQTFLDRYFSGVSTTRTFRSGGGGRENARYSQP